MMEEKKEREEREGRGEISIHALDDTLFQVHLRVMRLEEQEKEKQFQNVLSTGVRDLRRDMRELGQAQKALGRTVEAIGQAQTKTHLDMQRMKKEVEELKTNRNMRRMDRGVEGLKSQDVIDGNEDIIWELQKGNEKKYKKIAKLEEELASVRNKYYTERTAKKMIDAMEQLEEENHALQAELVAVQKRYSDLKDGRNIPIAQDVIDALNGHLDDVFARIDS